MDKMNMGVIIGNRDFFADELCEKGRNDLLPVLKARGINPIILDEKEGVYGSIQDRNDAKKSIELFKKNKESIKGIIVSLPNFGDEKSIVETIKESNINVPVLVHAFPDGIDKLDYVNRRDSFCGKISVCNNLRQFGINFTLTDNHTLAPNSQKFKAEIDKFIGVCNVIDKIKGARIGLIGIRPADFNTVRFSEKILQRNNISMEPISILDFVNKVEKLDNDNEEVVNSLNEINSYMDSSKVPDSAMLKMAKLNVIYDKWVNENEIDAVAFQCWDSLQMSIGINPCTVMSIFSNQGIPSACESDVMGALSMLALQATSESPSGLVDWNNNYGEDPDKVIIFHCGNFAKDIYTCNNSCPQINYPEILGSTLGQENTYGSIDGEIKSDIITFARVHTNDNNGKIEAYLAEGEVTDDLLDTFGSRGVVKVENLQNLMKYICENEFEHHVAINLSHTAEILEEAMTNYLGWKVYNHK